jgi:hypothetical protein
MMLHIQVEQSDGPGFGGYPSPYFPRADYPSH